jgi:hypothetical protein
MILGAVSISLGSLVFWLKARPVEKQPPASLHSTSSPVEGQPPASLQSTSSPVETQDLASLLSTAFQVETHPKKDGAGDPASGQDTSSHIETHPQKDGAGDLASLHSTSSPVETQDLASLQSTSSQVETHPQKDGAGNPASGQDTSSHIETPPKKDGAGNLASLQRQVKIVEALNFRTDFGRVILNQILQYVGIWTVTPLYILYLVKSLGAAESWLGINATVVNIGALLGSLLARYLIGRWGEPLVLKRFSQAASIYPILLGLSSGLTPVLFAGALNSLLLPSYSLSHNNNLLGSFPAGKEHEGIAVYNTVTSVGSFILPLAGVALANQFGIQPVLIGCGLLSLVGSLSFWIWPVKGEWKENHF